MSAAGKSLKLTLSLSGLFLLCACSGKLTAQTASTGQTKVTPGDGQLDRNRSPLKLPLIAPGIVVRKSQRQLLLLSNGKVVRKYRIGLGSSPVGDKVSQGDRRTPEGEFFVFVKNANSAFYLSLGLSYPNAAHAARGLRDGLITRAEHDAIMRQLRLKKGPPQNTKLGGDIYIHGNGAQSDWTWGCVALENDDMRELFDAVSVGTPVRIEA